jgi:exopolysaccharide production protein ExoQ
MTRLKTYYVPVGFRQAQARAGDASIGLRLALLWLVAVGLLAWLGTVLVPYQSYTSAALLAGVAIVPAIGLWVIGNAGAHGGGALAAMAFVVVLLSDWTLRGGVDRGLDMQSAAKFSIWASGLVLLLWRFPLVLQMGRHLPSISLLAFGVWAVFTATYSVTPLYSAAAGLAFLGLWVIATTLAVSTTQRLGLLVITLALLTGMAISLVLYFAVPDSVIVPTEGGTVLRFSGIFGSPNGTGRAAALALLTSLMLCYLLPRRQAVLLMAVVLTLSAACLYLSGSRASSLALVLGATVVLLHRRPWLSAIVVVGTGCAALVLFFMPDLRLELAAMISRTGSISEVTTFTGRTQIWAFVMQKIADAPLIGYGFASTREVITTGYFTMWGWTTTSAHNLWLQVWITTGLIGLVLIVISQLAWLREFVRQPDPVRDGLVVFVLTIGIFEAGPMGPSVNLLTMVMLWAMALGFRPRSP